MKILAELCQVINKTTGETHEVDEDLIDGLAHCGALDNCDVVYSDGTEIESEMESIPTPEQKPPRYDLRHRKQHKTCPDMPKPKIGALKLLTGI